MLDFKKEENYEIEKQNKTYETRSEPFLNETLKYIQSQEHFDIIINT